MKHLKSLLFIVLAVLSLSLVGCTNSNDNLECKTGIADITPDMPTALAGFAARKGLSDGIHRKIYTHCLVVRKGEEKICIISNDMMEVSPDFAVELRTAISEGADIPYNNIFIHNIHTHSAPRLVGATVEEGGSNYSYREIFAKTLIDNAVRTITSKTGYRRFTIEQGKGECFLNCNRCEKEGPIDHDLYAARLINHRGKPIMAMVNFSCHPVSLNHRSNLVSPDFPGIAVEELGKEWKCPVFYFTGASGNVDPCGKLRADTLYTQSRGEELASAAKEIKFTKLPASNMLKVVNEIVQLPYSIDEITPDAINQHAKELSLQTGVSDTWVKDIEGWRQLILERIAEGKVTNTLPIEIAAVNIGGLVLLFSQGEPFNEYQSVARAALPENPVFFIGYTNGQKSYLPSAHAFENPNKYIYETRQMHIYVKAPWILSSSMPLIYQNAINNILLESQL